MELKDLLPEQPTFKIGEKEYTIRKIGIRDYAWLEQKHGSHAKAMEMFQRHDYVAIAQFAYHQLSEDEKLQFRPALVSRVDDDGNEVSVKIGGPQVMLEAMSDDELSGMIAALSRAMIMANPQIEPAVRAQIEAQKKRMQTAVEALTGDGSSTSSPQSTATQSTNSET